MKLICPISYKFRWMPNICLINQLFGENKNALFYGPNGHQAWDIATVGEWVYQRFNQHYTEGRWTGGWKRIPREPSERQGFIPTVATHDGLLEAKVFPSDSNGYGVTVTAQPEMENGQMVQYQTLHYHLISPWSSFEVWTDRARLTLNPRQVRAGEIIAICDNTGKFTTGAHLHFEMRKRVRMNDGSWTDFAPVDPLPYFTDEDVVYHRWFGGPNFQAMYQGKIISHEEQQALLNSFPQLIV